MNKNYLKKYAGITIALFGAFALSIFLFFIVDRIEAVTGFFSSLASSLMPFIIGGGLAYALRPLANKLDKGYFKILKCIKDEKKRESVSESLSIFSCVMGAVVFFFIMLISIIPSVFNSLIKLAQTLPGNVQKFIEDMQEKLSHNELVVKYSKDVIDKTYEFINDFMNDKMLGYAQSIASSVTSGVISTVMWVLNIFIGFIICTYFLSSRKKFAKQGKMVIYSIFKPKKADAVMEEIRYADKVFSGFIYGKIIDAIAIAVLIFIGMKIFTFANPGKEMMSEVLIAVLVGIFNLIPFFGWYIAWFFGALLCLIINPAQCIFFVIFNFVIQQIDGNIIGPKIIGSSTGISSFWVLFAILFFGNLWGFIGMLLGVPIFAVIYHLIKKIIFKRLEINGMDSLRVEYEAEYPDSQK